MVIAIYSDEKKTGRTTLLYMLLRKIRQQAEGIRSLAVCMNQGEYGKLLKMEGIRLEDGQSVSAIANMAYSGEISKLSEVLPEKDGVYFTGNKNSAVPISGEILKAFFEKASHEFPLVFVDAAGGKRSRATAEILDICDGAINVVVQDVEMLRDGKFRTGKDMAVVVNCYRDIYPCLEDVQNMCRREKVFALPWCDRLMDMRNKGEIDKYAACDTDYNRIIGEICGYVLAFAGLKNDGAKDSPKGTKMFGLFF